ncbi:MAG: LysE family translocator [Alphaproteobacteria bacterium]
MDFYITQFFNLFLLNLMNLTSPGPETALMIHNSSYYSRKIGFYTGLGIVTSTIIHKTYSFLGFGAFISKSPVLFNTIKYAGGAYLAYLGLKMLFSPKKLLNADGQDNEYITHLKRMTPKKAFRMGFTIDILCPSASLVFISIVAATVDPSTPLSVQFMYGGLLVLSSFTWYTLQSTVFSHSVAKRILDKGGVWINRGMGAYMLYFAGKLMMRTL